MIKRIIHSQAKTIGTAALIIGLANIASRFLGVWRDRILAGTFGAGDELDVYYAAFRIPDLIFTLLVVGGLSASFIPIFLEYRQCGEEERKHWQIVSNVLNLTVGAVFLCALAAFFLMPWLIKIATPGFRGEKLILAVNLSRLILLSPILLAVSNIFGGVLQSFRKFLVFSFSAVFYNLGIIFGAVVLARSWGVFGLGWGVIAGALLQAAVQIPTLWGCGFRYQRVFDLRHPAVRQIVKLMIPRTLSLGTLQFNWIVMTALASVLAAGSLAIFNLANNFQGFVVGLFGVSFATAAFPALSEFGAKKDFLQFSKIFFSSLRQIFFFTLPASVLLIILAEPLIKIILETGAFSRAAASTTAGTLQFFSVSIFAQAAQLLLVRAFFALKNTRLPFLAALFTVALNVSLALLLLRPLDIRGLALAYSAASFFNFGLLLLFLKKIVPKEFFRNFWSVSYPQVVFGSGLVGLASWSVLYLSRQIYHSESLGGLLIQTGAAATAGVVVFAVFGLLVKSEEMAGIIRALKNIFRKNPPILPVPPPTLDGVMH